MILSSHVIKKALGLIEADPAEEAVVAALAREVSLAHVQVVVSVLVLIITLLAHKHQVAQLAHILLGLLSRPLEDLKPGRVKHQVLNVVLDSLVVDRALDEELPLGHAFHPLVRILDGL